MAIEKKTRNDLILFYIIIASIILMLPLYWPFIKNDRLDPLMFQIFILITFSGLSFRFFMENYKNRILATIDKKEFIDFFFSFNLFAIFANLILFINGEWALGFLALIMYLGLFISYTRKKTPM